ncbi:MAG: HAD-IA family hydrolase, partial [Thermomicrobiales bacterium]|nr:HAD-IA family hydrolase [Thermomicrobiales bacterium]
MNPDLAAASRLAGLLCDLDGVVRMWPSAQVAAAEDRAGLPRGSIHETAFAADLLSLAVTGCMSDEAWREEVTYRLQTTHPEADARSAVAGWSASPGVINARVRALLQRRRVPIALVTNATTRLPRDLDALGLTTEFDHVVSSARIGVAKPEWGIFAAALEALNLPPDRVLFVDDDARHVAAAASFGIRSHRFQGDIAELE